MISRKNRSTLWGLVGAYLLYLAYELFRDQSDTSMSMTVRVLFIVLFAVAGVGLIVSALVVWKRAQEEEEKEEKPDDQDSMK